MHIGSHGNYSSGHCVRPTGPQAAPQQNAHSRGDRMEGRFDSDCGGSRAHDRHEHYACDHNWHHGYRGASEGYGIGVDRQQAVARLADYLASPSAEQTRPDELAGALIARLDGDKSGALNSEEIAGTRLADKIGDGFFGVDADRSGTLDRAELGGFLAGAVIEVQVGAETATSGTEVPFVDDAVVIAEEINPEVASEDLSEVEVEPAVATGTATETATASSTSGLTYEQKVANAFEMALDLLDQGQAASWTVEIVQALYSDVKTIMGG